MRTSQGDFNVYCRSIATSKKNQLQLAPSSKSIFSCHIPVGISRNRTTDQARDQNDHNKLPSTVCFFQTCCCLISIKHTENYATFFACGINTTQHNLVFQKKHTNAYPVDPPFGTSHKGMCTLLLENPRQVQYVTPARIGRSPTEKGRKRAVLLCAARPGDRAQSDLPFQASLNALLESRGSRDGCQRERSSVSRASK